MLPYSALPREIATYAIHALLFIEQAAFDEDLSCGFLGVLAREYRGGGVSARYERIVIGKPPEMPRRDPSQDKYNAKYAYYKKSKRSQNKGQIIV